MEELLAKAGIQINGPRPWDMQLHAAGVLERVVSRGSLGLGEAYMDGDWDAEQLDEFFAHVLRARLDREVKPLSLLVPVLRGMIFNRQNLKRAWQVGEAHYDLGNEFYQAMLGPRMAYTCGYWKDAETLEQAQDAKLELICRKLRLRPGMRLLDIGCGWGGFMAYAAENYGVECVGDHDFQGAGGIRETAPFRPAARIPPARLSPNRRAIRRDRQHRHVRTRRKKELPHVHAGGQPLSGGDGIFLLHTIGKNERGGTTDPWIDKYIFPNGEIPSISHISDAMDGLLVTEDLHNFGADYDKTLMAWHANFEAAWPRFADSLGERFHRRWRYYLLSCAGAFRARDLQLWQWTLSKQGIQGGCPRVG